MVENLRGLDRLPRIGFRFSVVPLEAATAYDPEGDGHEEDGTEELAIDGNPTETSWTTEHYDTDTFAGTKTGPDPGVGIYVTTKAVASPSKMTILSPTPGWTAQIFAAPDVRTISGDIPGGGTATVVFSREKNAGVLVMNNVTPPKSGTVYQMWLIRAKGPESAGTMDATAVAPSTTAVLSDLGDSTALAFTIES